MEELGALGALGAPAGMVRGVEASGTPAHTPPTEQLPPPKQDMVLGFEASGKPATPHAPTAEQLYR